MSIAPLKTRSLASKSSNDACTLNPTLSIHYPGDTVLGLIVFGIGFGIIMGTGIFFLFILPLRKERQAEELARKRLITKKESEQNSDPKLDP
jgi:hypothetical protein